MKLSRAGLLRFVVLAASLLASLGLGAAYPLLARGRDWLGVTFQERWFLLGLLLVPVLLFRATYGQDRALPRIRMGTLGPLGRGPLGLRTWLRDVPGALRATALLFVVLALARPVSNLSPSSTEEEGIDLVLVLDLSGSMKAAIDDLPQELAPLVPPKRSAAVRSTRLDAAKAVIRDFVGRRKTDRIGVVVFGKDAYVLSPPTLDYHLLDALVSRMELNLIDGSATAIGDALGVAVARLRRSQATSKAIVLLTDGDNNAGKVAPEYAAHLATVVGAKVFTVQIGEGEMAEVFDGFDLFGQPRYETVSLPVNPELLQTIADKTSGRRYVATDARALQASLHDVLDQLEKTKFESSLASFEDLYRYLLLPGVLLAAVEALLRAAVLRRFP